MRGPKHFPKEIARGKKGTVVIWECAGITFAMHVTQKVISEMEKIAAKSGNKCKIKT